MAEQIWTAPDGRQWFYDPGTGKYLGFTPGENADWALDPAQFHADYPDAPTDPAEAIPYRSRRHGPPPPSKGTP